MFYLPFVVPGVIDRKAKQEIINTFVISITGIARQQQSYDITTTHKLSFVHRYHCAKKIVTTGALIRPCHLVYTQAVKMLKGKCIDCIVHIYAELLTQFWTKNKHNYSSNTGETAGLVFILGSCLYLFNSAYCLLKL